MKGSSPSSSASCSRSQLKAARASLWRPGATRPRISRATAPSRSGSATASDSRAATASPMRPTARRAAACCSVASERRALRRAISGYSDGWSSSAYGSPRHRPSAFSSRSSAAGRPRSWRQPPRAPRRRPRPRPHHRSPAGSPPVWWRSGHRAAAVGATARRWSARPRPDRPARRRRLCPRPCRSAARCSPPSRGATPGRRAATAAARNRAGSALLDRSAAAG